MLRLIKNRTRWRTNRLLTSRRFCAGHVKGLLLLLAATTILSGCGGVSGSPSVPQIPLTLTGNWQFTMAPPSDGSFLGGLQGGFLLDNDGAVTGAVAYAVSLSNLLIPCSTGSAAITGTISGQNVKTITAVAGTQTFTLTGTLSLDSSTMSGTYMSTAGTAADGTPCGTAQTGLQWSAILVPPLTGSIQGAFHSAGGAAGLEEQDFLVSGALNQAVNTGANATVTGNLSFLNSVTNLSDYPCFASAGVYGQISGNSVSLEIVGTDGSQLGLIGEPFGSLGVTGVNPVTFIPGQSGYILNGAGPSYLVATPLSGGTPCPGQVGNIGVAGDYGNICLALNGASGCQPPITLTPSALIFPAQALGSLPTMQTITLANASGTTLGGVTLSLTNNSGATNFTETDTCGVDGITSQGQPFDLSSGQSCVVTINYAPQESCAPGSPAGQCLPVVATLTVTIPSNGSILTAPITGGGVAQEAALTVEVDFDAEGASEARPQLALFGNPIGPTVANPSDRSLPDVEQHAEID